MFSPFYRKILFFLVIMNISNIHVWADEYVRSDSNQQEQVDIDFLEDNSYIHGDSEEKPKNAEPLKSKTIIKEDSSEELDAVGIIEEQNTEQVNSEVKSNINNTEIIKEEDKREVIDAKEREEDVSSEPVMRIELKEGDSGIIKTTDDIKGLNVFLNETKKNSKNINEEVSKLRAIRNKLYLKYQNDVDKILDDLLQRISFELGLFSGESLDQLYKSIGKDERSELKVEIEELDSLKDKILLLLQDLDNKYDNAVQLSIATRKLNLDVFRDSDSNNIKSIINEFKKKENGIKKIKALIKKIDIQFNLLISQFNEKTKIVEDHFKSLKAAEEVLAKQKKNLEKQKEDGKKALSEWRKMMGKAFKGAKKYYNLFLDRVNVYWLKVNSFLKEKKDI